jgi:hypothetical protein
MPKASSRTKSKSPLETALAKVSLPFRPKIIQYFLEVKKRLAEGKDESVGLAAGKLCECVLRFLQNEVSGKYTPFNKQIGNFADECRGLITSANTAVSESLRVVMPRALVFIYTVRNKRGIGHVGGDVDANRIDATTVARTCDWVVCELIRVYHSLSLEEAQNLVDGLAQRTIPDITRYLARGREETGTAGRFGIQAEGSTALLPRAGKRRAFRGSVFLG